MTASTCYRLKIALLLWLSLFVTPSARAQDAGAIPNAKPNADAIAPQSARTAMPDISGVWEHKPELREVVKENDGPGLMIDIPRGWLLIQKANENSADFTVVSVAQPSAAKSPKSKKQPAEKLNATLSRLRWSAESKRFDVLSHDEAFGPMTIELLDDGRLKVASKLDAAEQKNLATKKGIPEVLVKQVLNQIWNRVPLDKLDEASRQQIAEMANSSGTTTQSEDADPLPREGNPVPMMPDISGQWIFEVRAELPEPASLREIIGNPVKFDVSRSRESEGVFEFMEKGTTRSPKMLVKWLPDTRRFRTVTSEAKPNGEATLELTADGKLLRMLTTLDPSERKRLAKQFGVAEDALEQVLHQEFRRAEPSDVAAAPQDTPSNSKPLSPAEMLIQSGLGSFNPQAQPTDLTKPVQINLQPATQLAKLLVERFADRGAKVLEYEEGKRLKVEAPPTVLVQVGDLLGKVFQEPKQAEKRSGEFDMPDLSGKWRYALPDSPQVDPLTKATAPRDVFRVTRSEQPGSDFVFGVDGKENFEELRLKWIPKTRTFRVLLQNDSQPTQTILELSDDGNWLRSKAGNRELVFVRVPYPSASNGEYRDPVSPTNPTAQRGPHDPLASEVAADSKMPDISGVWAYETPGLPLKAKYDDGREVLAAQVALTQRYLVQRATDASADFTFKDITIVALPGTDPQPLTKQDARPERLKWNSQSKKFDMLKEGTASGTTLELLNNGRLKVASNVSAAERTRLAKEGGVSEATMEQLLHQTWVRVPLDKLDEATRKLVEAAPAGQPQLRHPVPHSDQQPRPGDFDRYFVVQRSPEQNETGSGERSKPFTVNVLPESPAIGFVKPGDRVDLYLPDFERLVVINANEVYVQPKRLIAASVPVVTFTEYLHGELRMTVMLTAAEESRIKSNPTWHDIAKMPITHVVRLKHASADHVVELIRQSFPFGVRDDDSGQNSLVSCESDLKQNAVILKEQPFSDDKPLKLIDVETAIRKLDALVDGKVGEAKSVRAIPDTPAAKQLAEQLAAQESAAAATAATIRELQSNGQAEQNKAAIAEHQRKLQILLSTAFDLKLQVEGLQIKVLESRLRMLHSQIDQRRELREKIINRRATELIEGDSFKWNSSDTPTQTNESRAGLQARPRADSSDGRAWRPALQKPVAEPIEPESKPVSLPSPEELKAKLKPFADPVKAAMQRVRDLEPTFFKDRSNLKEMQQALQQLAQARAAWQPRVKEIEAVCEELNLEQQLATITAKALGDRVAALTDKLGRGEATEAELRAAMKALRESPRMTGALNDRAQKMTATLTEFFELPLRADDVLPESIKSALNQSQPVQHPKQDPEFAIAWLESALQARLELVSLTELGLPVAKALRVKEGTHPKGDLQAGDLVVALLGEPIESLDQAVASFEAVKQPTSSDDRISIVMKGGIPEPRFVNRRAVSV